jgi:hypothetical protein
MIKASPLKWKFRHVKGHQDDYAGPLDRWAALNVEMDSLVKAHWLTATEGDYLPVQAIKFEPWSVWAADVKFIHPIKHDMYSHIHNPILDEYWHSRDRYQPATQDNWDWQALADAMKKTTITRRHWLTKHTSGWCSVGVMAKRWKLRASDACPRCTSVETTRHVWRCQHQGALEVWDKSMERLQLEMGRLYTNPSITQVILQRLHDWKRHRPLRRIHGVTDALSQAIASQDKLGWGSFLEGGFSKYWRSTQERYILYSSSHKSSRQWATALILKLFNVAWDQWEHRNHFLHEVENKFDQEEALQVDNQIRQEFVTGSRLLAPGDHSLFKAGLK